MNLADYSTPSRTSRRSFLKAASLSASSLVFPHILRGQAPKKLQFGGIGVEGKGKADLLNTSAGAEIVALCDVDRTRLERAKLLYPNARLFQDFREMFEKLGDKIDALTAVNADLAAENDDLQSAVDRKVCTSYQASYIGTRSSDFYSDFSLIFLYLLPDFL